VNEKWRVEMEWRMEKTLNEKWRTEMEQRTEVKWIEFLIPCEFTSVRQKLLVFN
jgi:hypothetical protein